MLSYYFFQLAVYLSFRLEGDEMMLYDISQVDWNSEDAFRYIMITTTFPFHAKALIRSVYKCYPVGTLSRVASALDSEILQFQRKSRKILSVSWDLPESVFISSEILYSSFDEVILSACVSEKIKLWKLAFSISYNQFYNSSAASIRVKSNENKKLFLIISEKDRLQIGENLSDYMEDLSTWIENYIQTENMYIKKLYIRFDTLLKLLNRQNE